MFTRYDDNLARHIYLRTLQDINEALFYKLVTDHPEEMLLIVCTPTIARLSLYTAIGPGPGQPARVVTGASMPLRVWHTDEVTPLAPHPNDPALVVRSSGTEFLTTFTIIAPRRACPPRPCTIPRRARRGARRSWPGRGICCGCGGCPAVRAQWACGTPPHREVAPAQGVRQAGHQLPPRGRAGPEKEGVRS